MKKKRVTWASRFRRLFIAAVIVSLFSVLAWIWWVSSQQHKATPPAPLAVRAQQVPRPATQLPTTNPPAVVIAVNPKVLVQPVESTPVLMVTKAQETIPTNSPTPQTVDSGPGFSQPTLDAQICLTRHAISPGSIDGVMGYQTRAGLRAFQQKWQLPVTGAPDLPTLERLSADSPLFRELEVSAEDLARLRPLGATWLAKSQQDRLDYESILELMAEKSQSSPILIRRLNPGINWSNILPGTVIKAPAALFPEPDAKAAYLRISLSGRVLEAFGDGDQLLAHFPCSIGQRAEKRPVGQLHISVIAPNPNYTFDPEVFPESQEGRELGHKLILQPGPNNPVGTVWIGLDLPGYGIHGTPRPEQVGRTESHGCFRLANWNAEYLAQLVRVGVPVIVDP